MVNFQKKARDVAVNNLEAHRGVKNAMEKDMLVWLETTYGSTIQILTTTKIMIRMVHAQAQSIIKISEHFICIESI